MADLDLAALRLVADLAAASVAIVGRPDGPSDHSQAVITRADLSCYADALADLLARCEAADRHALAADRMLEDAHRYGAELHGFIYELGRLVGAEEKGYGAASCEADEARYRRGVRERVEALVAAEAEVARLKATLDRATALLDRYRERCP